MIRLLDTPPNAPESIPGRPNAGMAAYYGRLQSDVGDQTVRRHSIHGEAHRQSKTICFHTLKTDVSASR